MVSAQFGGAGYGADERRYPAATDCFLPKDGGPRFPVLLMRSFYGRKSGPDTAKQYNAMGIAFVVQDTRGRGESEGKDMVFADDGWHGHKDGADTVDWVRAQPWCDGRVGTMGGSALGITQVLMAGSTQKVACQSMVVASSDFYGQLAYEGGVFRKALAETWLTAIKSPYIINVWRGHPTDDSFWRYYDAEQRAGRITAPGIHIGGWFDIFSQGTINNFVTRQQHGGKGARGNQILIMGPWPHGVAKKTGDLELADNFKFDTDALQNRFFRHWLLGEANGVMDESPVHYYTMGARGETDAPGNEWRTAQTWPPFPTTATPYYLGANHALAEDGRAPEAGKAEFTYDPANPCPTHGGRELTLPAGPFDQREVSVRPDVLKFETPSLERPVEITGDVRVLLYVSSDAPDTDFTAKLVDIYPDGREILILDGIRRLKFRYGYHRPQPLTPGQVGKLEIDLWSTSLIVNKGHKIGLQISSSNYPRFEKNPNTGADFPLNDPVRIAHNTVYFGKAHPSAMILPVKP